MLEIAKREAIRASEKQPCTWYGFVCNRELQKPRALVLIVVCLSMLTCMVV